MKKKLLRRAFRYLCLPPSEGPWEDENFRKQMDLLKGEIMHTLEEMKASLDDVKGRIGSVKGGVDALMAKLANMPKPGLTDEQQAIVDSSVEEATAISAAMAGIDDAINPKPAPVADAPATAASGDTGAAV